MDRYRIHKLVIFPPSTRGVMIRLVANPGDGGPDFDPGRLANICAPARVALVGEEAPGGIPVCYIHTPTAALDMVHRNPARSKGGALLVSEPRQRHKGLVGDLAVCAQCSAVIAIWIVCASNYTTLEAGIVVTGIQSIPSRESRPVITPTWLG